MNKKSKYLIIALIFIILAMAWQLYIRTQPTQEEEKKIRKEAMRIPDPEGTKIYENTSHPFNSGLRIGVESILSSTVSCNFIFPDGKQEHEYMEVNESKYFKDNEGSGFDIILLSVNKDDRGEYGIFDIVRTDRVVLSYQEKQQAEEQVKRQRLDEAITNYEKRLNEKVEDAFLESREKMSLDREYRDNWDESKTFRCTVQKVEQYRDKETEVPSAYSLYDLKVTYFFKVYVTIPDGVKVYKTEYIVTVKDENGVATVDKPLMIDFDEL